MEYQQLLTDIGQYVLRYYEGHHDANLLYHNLEHTRGVVSAATQIANHYQLNDEDFFVVSTAAWFHDVGYMKDQADHEAAGAELAEAHLKQLNVPQLVIDKVKGCIMATRIPQKPENQLQEIVCDSDLFHLGTEGFAEKSKLLRKEFNIIKHLNIDKTAWRNKNIELLRTHQYFTDYAQLLLGEQQQKNLESLVKKQQNATNNNSDAPPANLPTDAGGSAGIAQAKPAGATKKSDDKKKDDKKNKPDKGIETMFRITSGNNQRLSDMADNKAHILITVNSIILSAIISLVLRKLEENSFLAIPSFILLTVSLLSMIFSILATRPAIPQGTFTAEDIDEKKVNLLFFGNFYKMGLEEYTAGMLKVMDDRGFLYGTLIKDVYSQGVVLGRKYRFLRVAYNIFMFGLILAVLAYIASSILHDDAPLGKH